MNCKQGDLAVIVRSSAGNEGKIVRCLRLHDPSATIVRPDGREYKDALWEIDMPLPTWNGPVLPYIPDNLLRPIRDPGDDATDEMILLLGKPVREGETA